MSFEKSAYCSQLQKIHVEDQNELQKHVKFEILERDPRGLGDPSVAFSQGPGDPGNPLDQCIIKTGDVSKRDGVEIQGWMSPSITRCDQMPSPWDLEPRMI